MGSSKRRQFIGLLGGRRRVGRWQRSGFTEEAHFNVTYSTVPDGSSPNSIGGVLATVHEIGKKLHNPRAALLDQKSICDDQRHHAREDQQCRK